MWRHSSVQRRVLRRQNYSSSWVGSSSEAWAEDFGSERQPQEVMPPAVAMKLWLLAGSASHGIEDRTTVNCRATRSDRHSDGHLPRASVLRRSEEDVINPTVARSAAGSVDLCANPKGAGSDSRPVDRVFGNVFTGRI